MRLTAEQAAKQRFVERKFAPALVAATEYGITGLLYEADGDDEHVSVIFRSAGDTELVLKVNVSCDSLLSIMWDVMKALREKCWT